MERRIKEIRENSREGSFCLSLTKSSFDEIVELLFNDAIGDPTLARALLAGICNIVLLNRGFNEYCAQKFGSKFVDLFEEDISLCQKDFDRLVAEYRLLFLMLFHIECFEKGRRQKIGTILNAGFNNMLFLYPEYGMSPLYEKSLIELLKAIYSFYQSNNAEDNLFEEHMSELFAGIVTLFNYTFAKPRSSSFFSVNSLLKQLTSVLLLLFTKYQNQTTKCISDLDNYDEFFHNLVDTLKAHLELFSGSNSNSDDINHLIIILTSLNCMVDVAYKSYFREHDKYSREEGERSSPLLQLGNFIPKDSDNFFFKKLLLIIILSSDTSLDRPYSDMKSLMQLKNIILDLYYKLTWHEDQKVHSISFLKLFGYENIVSFIEGNDLSLEGVNPEEFLAPDPEFMDDETTALRLSVRSQAFAFDNDSNQSVHDSAPMDEKEKEREAEKLFYIFNQMEKSTAFPNFINPVREWQQLGKFEELSDLGSEE